MSIRVMTTVWSNSRHSGTDLLMLLALADFSDDAGNSYPSVPTLATKCRMTGRNANYILSALQRSGELEVRPNEGPKGTNRYRIVLDALGVQGASGVKTASPCKALPAPLKPGVGTPEAAFPNPLKPASDEPSLNRQKNRQEPSEARNRASRRSRRCPADFVITDTMRSWAGARAPGVDIDRETESFRDHEFNAPRGDWPAAWRNWMRKARPTVHDVARQGKANLLMANNVAAALRFLEADET